MTEETSAVMPLRKAAPSFAWEGVDRLPYKEADAAPFKAVSRQTLFSDARLNGELRYFEIEPGGFSSPRDLVTIEPWTWHQFRARREEPLGFLCLVNSARDKPQLPNAEDLALLRATPAVAQFLDGF